MNALSTSGIQQIPTSEYKFRCNSSSAQLSCMWASQLL